jgi:ribosomal protein S18 acetylase RimI-like enzyme
MMRLPAAFQSQQTPEVTDTGPAKPAGPTAAELASLVDANYAFAFATLAANSEGGETLDGEGLVLAITGLPSPAFNVAFVLRPLTDPARQIRDAVGRFDAHGVPFQITVRERLDPLTERACSELGLVPRDELLPGMVLTDVAVADAHPALEGLRFADVDDLNLHDHIAVAARAFDAPRDLMSRITTPQLLGVPAVRAFVGYIDDTAVATGVLIVSHRVAGVFNIATDEGYRRRGIGEAMTWHVIREGRRSGCTVAALQASDLGRSVYERMGFRLVSPYLEFRRPS